MNPAKLRVGSSRENPMKARPKLVISSLDIERLEELLSTTPDINFHGKTELENELRRAEVVEPEEMPPSVVTMNSRVKFQIKPGKRHHLKLVYPKDLDPNGGSVSILSPVGSALLGLSEKDEIAWPNPAGEEINLLIEEVTYQPEREGEFHR